MEQPIELRAGDYCLVVSPERGGSILAFEWQGFPLMRPTAGGGILDVACFPLVPFCNRIAHGRFVWDGRNVTIAPNFPGSDHPHPLHGFGWLAGWTVLHRAPDRLVLEHRYPGGEWPWPYRAELAYAVGPGGLNASLSLANMSDAPMPAGLGFHPYFPRNERTRYLGLHRGEWRNDSGCLPLSLDERDRAGDWWQGAPVSARAIDTVFAGREGPLTIEWSDRSVALTLEASPNLSFTAVYAPSGVDWFCVEPMSQMTNALNSSHNSTGLTLLNPGESMVIAIDLHAASFAPVQQPLE